MSVSIPWDDVLFSNNTILLLFLWLFRIAGALHHGKKFSNTFEGYTLNLIRRADSDSYRTNASWGDTCVEGLKTYSWRSMSHFSSSKSGMNMNIAGKYLQNNIEHFTKKRFSSSILHMANRGAIVELPRGPFYNGFAQYYLYGSHSSKELKIIAHKMSWNWFRRLLSFANSRQVSHWVTQDLCNQAKDQDAYIPVGYADGTPVASNKGSVLIHDKRVILSEGYVWTGFWLNHRWWPCNVNDDVILLGKVYELLTADEIAEISETFLRDPLQGSKEGYKGIWINGKEFLAPFKNCSRAWKIKSNACRKHLFRL
jgi:hypothetical protein